MWRLIPLLLLSSSALAYVRTRTDDGTAIRWPQSCVHLFLDSNGTADLPRAQVEAALARAAHSWTDLAGCSYVQLVMAGTRGGETLYDRHNLVKFRPQKWCHPPDPAIEKPESCHDAAATAITTVAYVNEPGAADDGTLLDADIELNDVDFVFREVTPGVSEPYEGARMPADLESTLTHELGHLLGLDHTCADLQAPHSAVDETGARPPRCADIENLPLEHRTRIETATMFNFAVSGDGGVPETRKRSPEPDDIAGLCEAYPLAADPKSCSAPDNGCSFAGARAPLSAFVVLALLAFLARRRIRR